MRISKILIGAAFVAASVPGVSHAIELQAGTVKAWESYIRSADLRMHDRLGAQPFLWTDQSADRAARVRRGEVVVEPVVGHGTQDVPNGLIHDWIGAIFLPHANLASLLDVVHDYGRYKDMYKPAVADSKVLACTATDQEFSMVWQRRVLFVSAAMEGRYRARDFAVDGRRGYNIANTTRVQEIEGYGHGATHLLPPDIGNGFIWRLHSIARYEEREGGVFLELEVIALTREIPSSLRWLVSPVVKHLSINSLTATLSQTRDAVKALPEGPQRVAVCNGRSHTLLADGSGGRE
jgi:hypothetical protein